jgi:hypothetical protein
MAKARDLVFFGFSGSADRTGTVERDKSFFCVAHTLKLHLERRFPDDVVEIRCAWHKDTFVNALRSKGADPDLKIRQIHCVDHGAGGGLYFGYHHPGPAAGRATLAAGFTKWPMARLSDAAKRRFALRLDAGLMSGFFSDAFEPANLADIRANLAPDALLHVWGCFAGAPAHTFDTADAYWNLFNDGKASVEGVARHIARTLQIEATACHDPRGSAGMDFCTRDPGGKFNCTDKRPERLPHWLWPEAKRVRWITWDSTGTGDDKSINFLGTRIPATTIPPGKPPPKWFTDEVPRATAKAKLPTFPACSADASGV